MADATYTPMSQVQMIGLPAPKTWDDYADGCFATFGGGYQSKAERGIFQHGMETVFNLLRSEFPPAEQCKFATDLLAELEANVKAFDDIAPTMPWMSNDPAWWLAWSEQTRRNRAAIAKARGA